MDRLTEKEGVLRTINKAQNDISFLKQIVLKLAKYEDLDIAKTPIQSFYNEGNYAWGCLNCENTVDEGQHYCHHCGQKLLEWD